MKVQDGRIVEATMPELYALYHRGYGGKMAKMFTFTQYAGRVAQAFKRTIRRCARILDRHNDPRASQILRVLQVRKNKKKPGLLLRLLF